MKILKRINFKNHNSLQRCLWFNFIDFLHLEVQPLLPIYWKPRHSPPSNMKASALILADLLHPPGAAMTLARPRLDKPGKLYACATTYQCTRHGRREYKMATSSQVVHSQTNSSKSRIPSHAAIALPLAFLLETQIGVSLISHKTLDPF